MAMRRAMTLIPALVLCALTLCPAASAETTGAMKATAPDKMMPSVKAAKMRACDKLAMDRPVRMADRAKFVAECVASKTSPN